MSMRLEMLQVGRLAPKLLGESTGLVRDFLIGQRNSDGGFRNRDGRSDLYYTVFGIDSLIALQAEHDFAGTENYVRGFGDGAGLDFVHLCCLARAWAALGLTGGLGDGMRQTLLGRVEAFRTPDGGYNASLGAEFGTAYGAFLGLGAYQDAGGAMPNSLELVRSLKFLETADSAWGNDRKVQAGSTNATAAMVTLLRNLSMPVSSGAGDWLLRRLHAQGGFVASEATPIPDLLSTATALHALAGLERDLSGLAELCLDYVDSLWTNLGSFHGNWMEEELDSEYTFYGLLALGHLSVA